MTDHLTVTTPSGRTLRVLTAGNPAHACVFVLHGSPSSGMLYPPNVKDAAAHGLRLVSYDRPGYGGSAPHPGRTVGDAAADAALAGPVPVGAEGRDWTAGMGEGNVEDFALAVAGGPAYEARLVEMR